MARSARPALAHHAVQEIGRAAEDTDAVRDAHQASAYARLRGLKRRYDPDKVFRANHNIRPA